MHPSSLAIENVRKVHYRSSLIRRTSFQLEAHLTLEGPNVVGVLGSNGSGKSTLFDLIAGSQAPTEGRVFCGGKDIHRVRFQHRARLVHHRQQRFATARKSHWDWSPLAHKAYETLFSYEPVPAAPPAIHLFDEPDMNDEYTELRLNLIHELRTQGQLVLLCIHPQNTKVMAIVRRLCDRYLFLEHGRISELDGFDALLAHSGARHYLGDMVPAA